MDLFIKKLAEEFKKQFICVGENTEKYIAFTVPIEKEVTKIDKNGEHIKYIYIYIYICYILQFIDNVIELNVDLDTMIKKCETCGIKYKYCDCSLEHANVNDDLIEYKYLLCYKNCQRKFDEKLKKRFFDTN